MLSRSLFLAACFALAAADGNLQCTTSLDAPCKGCCRSPAQTLDEATSECSDGAGDTCNICDGGCQSGDIPGPVCHLLDQDGKQVPVTDAGAAESPGRVGGQGAGSGLPSTTPSAGVKLTLGTFNGMDGWLDIKKSIFTGFSGFLMGLTATVPSFYTAKGYTVQYSCQQGSVASQPEQFKACNAFFFIYKCPPCGRENGGVAAQLMSMDEPRWYAGNCGPTFMLNKDVGAHHSFAVWQADIKLGEKVDVKLTSPAEFMFWAIVGKSIVCSERSMSECNAESDNCIWLPEDGVCRPKGCPPPTGLYGPNTPKCQVCVSDEEDFIPEVVFN